jgi:hypothetical protein
MRRLTALAHVVAAALLVEQADTQAREENNTGCWRRRRATCDAIFIRPQVVPQQMATGWR